MYVYLKNQFINKDNAFISIEERGFKFGDGLFETIIVHNSKLYNWPAHINRLQAGLAALKIKFELSDLKPICIELIEKNKLLSGFIRISISRGVGSIGYLPKADILPSLIIQTLENENIHPDKAKLCLSSYRKISPNALPVNNKISGNLNSILAKIEAEEHGCFEAVLMDAHRNIAECSSSNIFWVKDGAIYTPSLKTGALAGTIREKLISLSPIRVNIGEFQLENLLEADEVFITNVAFKLLPVSQVDTIIYNSHKIAYLLKNLILKDIESV